MFVVSRRETHCTKTRKERRDWNGRGLGDGGENYVGGCQDVDGWSKEAHGSVAWLC